MKNTLATLGVLSVLFASQAGAQTLPLSGKTIALDAGHGGGETGAIGYCGVVSAVEADVNLAVRAALKLKLEGEGATVYEIRQLPTRKERVQDAENHGANVLISIHHNGSTDLTADYTRSYVTQRNDKMLALPIHKALVAALKLPDKGIKSDGYGMTVYGSLPGVLTEAYFITDTDGACDFVNNGNAGRVEIEAEAMRKGLVGYFSL